MGNHTRWLGWLLLLLFLHLPIVSEANEKDEPRVGFLAVSVTIGTDQGPSKNAFVLVRGYRPGYPGESSTILKPTADGFFETPLPPGLYDVFVSEVSSLPMCKRVEIVPGKIEHYTVNLKADEEHLQQ
jgi:hypothetical protein